MVGGIVEPVFPVEGDTYEIDGELLGRRQVSGGQGRDGGIEYCPSVMGDTLSSGLGSRFTRRHRACQASCVEGHTTACGRRGDV
jgi:hypothetical protein